jgi:glucuronate isomerase
MARYFDLIMETAGLYNTCGFNDDTRALPSIPARHDTWRRASANWLAGLVARHIIDMSDAHDCWRLDRWPGQAGIQTIKASCFIYDNRSSRAV